MTRTILWGAGTLSLTVQVKSQVTLKEGLILHVTKAPQTNISGNLEPDIPDVKKDI